METKYKRRSDVSLLKHSGSARSGKIWTLKKNVDQSKQGVGKPEIIWKNSPTIDRLSLIWSHSPSCRRGFQLVRESAIARFRYVAKMVMACVAWDRCESIRKVEKHTSIMSFMQADTSPTNLLFDASLFKANKEIGVHREVRRILSLPSNEKTDKQLQLVLIALRDIPSFAEYPTPMQRQMCRLGWYQKVEPNRVIIREGQVAYNFYFILSGTVVITEQNKVTKSSQTKCMLQRGMEFGAQALFKKTYRSATVASHTPTELLCLDAHDMAETYLCGRDVPIKDQKIINFLNGLYYLKDFPISILQSNPESLMFHYFKQDQVLVKNSRFSDWLYIVKSGSISVLKKLHCSKLPNKQPRSAQNVKLSNLIALMDRRSLHGRESTVASVSKLTNWKRRVNPNDVPISKLEVASGALVSHDFSRLTLPCIYEEPETESDCDKRQATFMSGIPLQRHFAPAVYNCNLNTSLPPLVEGKMSVVAMLDAGKQVLDPDYGKNRTEKSDEQTFITVCVLEKGQCFGIATTIFGNQPSLSVISNGADCFLLSKQLFFKHCSEQTLNKLKEQELPYPTDHELSCKLQDYNKWTKFKTKHYQHAVLQSKK